MIMKANRKGKLYKAQLSIKIFLSFKNFAMSLLGHMRKTLQLAQLHYGAYRLAGI